MRVLNMRSNAFLALLSMYLLLSLTACSSMKELATNKRLSKKKRVRTERVKTDIAKDKSKPSDAKDVVDEEIDPRRDRLVTYASRFLYRPYRYGGQDPSGFDCSGFTSFIFNNYGLGIPRTSKAQSKEGKRVAIDKVEPGDLMFFGSKNKVSHVAMVYSRENNKLKIIHATSSSGIIITHYTDSDYWIDRFLFAKDIVSTKKIDLAFR